MAKRSEKTKLEVARAAGEDTAHWHRQRHVRLGLTPAELDKRIKKMKQAPPEEKPPSLTNHERYKRSRGSLEEQMKRWKPRKPMPAHAVRALIYGPSKAEQLRELKKYEDVRARDWWAPKGHRHT